MNKKQTENTVFDIILRDNVSRVEKLSHCRIPWYLRIKSRLQRWYLRSIKKLDPYAERIIRFYTYNDDDGEEYDFKCPQYAFDLTSCLYDDFVEACHEIGESIQKHYGVVGKYFYDVKVTLSYSQVGNPLDGIEWEMDWDWKILKTDNPRCTAGNSRLRKDCEYLGNYDSRLMIEGYSLSGDYKRFADVLSALTSKVVVMHSVSDSRAFLRIMKFLGVTTVYTGTIAHYNAPVRYGKFNRSAVAYYLDRIDDTTSVCTMRKCALVSVSAENILDIDEFIVKRSLKSRYKDWRGK